MIHSLHFGISSNCDQYMAIYCLRRAISSRDSLFRALTINLTLRLACSMLSSFASSELGSTHGDLAYEGYG